jgi:hypothetical protein
MARGWESKSVEEQQAEFSKNSGATNKNISKEERLRGVERQRLQLARANVSNQLKLAGNARYVELLTRELEELERKLTELG